MRLDKEEEKNNEKGKLNNKRINGLDKKEHKIGMGQEKKRKIVTKRGKLEKMRKILGPAVHGMGAPKGIQ